MLSVGLNSQTKEDLQQISAMQGVSKSDFVRNLIGEKLREERSKKQSP